MKDAVEADKKAFQLVVEGKCDSPIRTNIQAPKYDGSFLLCLLMWKRWIQLP